jgi:WD40 repeat protein
MLILQGHRGRVRCLAYSPEGRFIASGGDDGKVRLWDLPAGQECAVWPGSLHSHPAPVRSVAFSLDGEILASGALDGVVRFWEVETRQQCVHGRMLDRAWSLALAPDRRLFAVGLSGGRIQVAEVGRPEDPETTLILSGADDIVYALAFSPDGRSLASGGYDRDVRVWPTALFRDPRPPPSEWGGGVLPAWRFSHLRETFGQATRCVGHGDWVRSLAFRPDGELLASGSDDLSVRLWDPQNGSAITVLRGHEDRVWSVAFLPDGETLASASWDGTVIFWGLRSRRERGRFGWRMGRVHAVAFSPDGSTAAAGGENGDIVVWDVDDMTG